MSFLDPILSPLLDINPTLAIGIITFSISIVITLAYKYFTDQDKMKSLKKDLKDLQKKMKDSRDKPEKLMAIQKEAMDKNMKFMSHSMRPSLITLIPILLLFSWLNANFAYLPIDAGTEFNIDIQTKIDGPISLEIIPEGIEIISSMNNTIEKEAKFTLKGEAKEYTLRINFEDEEIEKDLIIGNTYAGPDYKMTGNVKRVTVGNEKLKVNILGFQMTWFWAYILFSILFSTLLRKAMKIY